ncbi:leucine-rich repeat domain-containing protein [Proteinivorax hydrogeniformans]|uniref:Leucine-rich repeat domain-containing protein n=1 Tax=Proteinivorax hydrogeniformans TaxID=1826727 RepID=A0AAU8HVD5_9FIRM
MDKLSFEDKFFSKLKIFGERKRNNFKAAVISLAIILVFLVVRFLGSYHVVEIDVVATPEKAGEVTGTGRYQRGERVSVSAEAKQGYVLEKWTKDGEMIEFDDNGLAMITNHNFEAQADAELVAHFEKSLDNIDDVLASAIKEELKITGNIRLSDMEDIQSIIIDGSHLQDRRLDLSGIEYAENLETVVIRNFDHVDLNPLYNLTRIKSLKLSAIGLDDINSLQTFSNLKELDLSSNSLTNLSSLESLTSLQELTLMNNGIEDIKPITELNNLTKLDISHNKVECISEVSKLTDIRHLLLHSNDIENVTPLKKLKNLKTINIVSQESGLKEPKYLAYELAQLPKMQTAYIDNKNGDNIFGINQPLIKMSWSLNREHLAIIGMADTLYFAQQPGGEIMEVKVLDAKALAQGKKDSIFELQKEQKEHLIETGYLTSVKWEEDSSLKISFSDNLKIYKDGLHPVGKISIDIEHDEVEVKWEKD